MGPADIQYTWHGGRSSSRLDCFFISTYTAALFPAASCTSRARPSSDHTPIMWSDGVHLSFKYLFRIQSLWMSDPMFKEIVSSSWSADCDAPNATERVLLKFSRLRTALHNYRQTRIQ